MSRPVWICCTSVCCRAGQARRSSGLILRLHGRLEKVRPRDRLLVTLPGMRSGRWTAKDLDATLNAFRLLKEHVETVADRWPTSPRATSRQADAGV